MTPVSFYQFQWILGNYDEKENSLGIITLNIELKNVGNFSKCWIKIKEILKKRISAVRLFFWKGSIVQFCDEVLHCECHSRYGINIAIKSKKNDIKHAYVSFYRCFCLKEI